MAEPRARTKVLVLSHSHPNLSRGGAEISAFELFRAFRDTPTHEAWFLGCQRGDAGRLGTGITQPFSDREFVYGTGEFDWFKFANRDQKFPPEFRAMLERLRPDVVHFHHFINLGVEAFLLVREVLPNAKIILTVHEYLAICHHFGQMVTTDRQNLCYEATPLRCNGCFPTIGASDFFLRQLYIQGFLRFVDQFIAPSHFLAERLIQWGLPQERIAVIENLIPVPADRSETIDSENQGTLRVGFFGQISRLKGINVLFDTAAFLEAQEVDDIVFDIHGDYRGQPPQFQEEFLKRLEGAGRNVQFHGAYDARRVDKLMRQVDVTIVPSIWWENSPVVIQEAFRNRRPVICSDIGGMAEKVRHGQDGWHFPAGSSVGLTSLLKRLRTEPEMINTVMRTMAKPPSVESVIAAHRHIYEPTIRTKTKTKGATSIPIAARMSLPPRPGGGH